MVQSCFSAAKHAFPALSGDHVLEIDFAQQRLAFFDQVANGFVTVAASLDDDLGGLFLGLRLGRFGRFSLRNRDRNFAFLLLGFFRGRRGRRDVFLGLLRGGCIDQRRVFVPRFVGVPRGRAAGSGQRCQDEEAQRDQPGGR
jgi:hypothetical protein